jgi:hypothetical protein
MFRVTRHSPFGLLAALECDDPTRILTVGEIAVFPQDVDPYGALIYPLDGGRSRRHLVHSVVGDVKVSGESLIDDMPQWLAGRLGVALQQLPHGIR